MYTSQLFCCLIIIVISIAFFSVSFILIPTSFIFMCELKLFEVYEDDVPVDPVINS